MAGRRFLARLATPLRVVILVVPTLILLVAGGASAWLLLTTGGLRWAAETAAEASDGRLRIEVAGGRLLGAVELASLSIDAGGGSYVLHDITLAWHPERLFDKVIDIATLHVGRLDIASGGEGGAGDGQPPADLRPPFEIRIAALSIGEMRLIDGASARVIARDIEVAAFAADADAYALERLAARLDNGTLAAQGRLGAIAPFAVAFSADFAGRFEERRFDLRLVGRGDLSELAVDLAGSGAGATLAGRARLGPFAEQPLKALRLTADKLDPRLFVAAAPAAQLRVDVDLVPTADGGFAGRAQVDNARPASLDQGGLPVVRATAKRIEFASTEGSRRLRLDGLDLQLVKQGRLAGRVDLVWPRAQPWPQGSAELTLRGVDLAALHGELPPAVLDGSLSASVRSSSRADGRLRLALTDTRQGGTLELTAEAANDSLTMRAAGRALRLDATHSLPRIDVELAGTRARHTLTVDAALTAKREVSLALSGGLAAWPNQWRDAAWQGTLDRFRLTGDWPVALAAPAALALHRERVSLGETPLNVAGGRLVLAESRWTPAGWNTGGRFADISLALPNEPVLARAAGEWSLSSTAAGVLAGTLRARVPDVRGFGPLLGEGVSIAGALEIDTTIAGSLAAPRLQGRLRGSGLAVGLAEHNINFRDGVLDVRLAGDRAVIERLEFAAPDDAPKAAARIANYTAGQPGRLTVTGEIDLDQIGTRLDATLTRVPLAQRADRWVVASGTARIEYAAERLRLNAQLQADAGFIGGVTAGRPVLADDIVVLGREVATRQALLIESDIALALGRHFHLRTAGLTARLSGQLRLRGDGRSPLVATGSIATRDARYEAYGQRLTVQRGVVNFQGRLEDPGLDLVAVREGLAVEAGVAVTGTAQRPVVRLVSTPEVPDAEKLSWIVLGRPPDSGGADTALLMAAAGSVFGGEGAGPIAKIANALGVDEISFRQQESADAPLAAQIVTVGKRLSTRTFLSYEQGLTAAAGTLKLSYALTRRLSLVSRAGADNALDIFYNFFLD